MKILITTPFYYPDVSGISKTVENLVHGLNILGHLVDVLTTNAVSPNKNDRIEKNNIYRVESKKKEIKKKLDQLNSEGEYDAIVSVCWQCKITDVTIPYCYSKGFRNLYLYSHGVNFFKNIYPGPKGWLRQIRWCAYWVKFIEIILKVDGLIVLSTNSSSNVFIDRKIAGFLKKRVKEIWNSIDLGGGDKVRSQPLSFYNYILSVGNYLEVKNFEEAIDGYIESGSTKDYVIVGSSETEYLNRLINKYKNYKKVHFLVGVSRDELVNYISNASLVLLSSYIEIQPLVILESVALGTPYLARDLGSISEIPGGCVFARIDEEKQELILKPKDELKTMFNYPFATKKIEELISPVKNAARMVDFIAN